ncbi:MAG: hypothetical protein WCK51_06230 [Armatimonadota bacterium]
MKHLKLIALALFVIMALIFIGCGGAFPGVAGGDTNSSGYGNDNNQPNQ